MDVAEARSSVATPDAPELLGQGPLMSNPSLEGKSRRGRLSLRSVSYVHVVVQRLASDAVDQDLREVPNRNAGTWI